MTGASTLDPDNFPGAPDRSLGKGHGIDSLGPSDVTDSGSDVVGGPGFSTDLDDDQKLDLGTGTNEEPDTRLDNAGSDMGDPNLVGDSDYGGTGERAAPGRDIPGKDGQDIGTDHIESIPNLPLTDEDVDFLGSQPPRGRAPGK